PELDPPEWVQQPPGVKPEPLGEHESDPGPLERDPRAVAALDRVREAAEPALRRRRFLDLELGQVLEFELDDAADPIGDRRVTAQDESPEREGVADLVDVGGLEANRPLAPHLEVADPRPPRPAPCR